jgi:hypothetical protein
VFVSSRLRVPGSKLGWPRFNHDSNRTIDALEMETNLSANGARRDVMGAAKG